MASWPSEGPREPRVDDRVLEMLSESGAHIAFSGLRRALRVHPESLTRALRRLERNGAVVRSEDGYALREPTPPHRGGPSEARTVASVELPPGTQSDNVRGRIAGRWFGRLRWVGVYERPGDPWLVWSIEGEPGTVMLSVRPGTLRVLSDAPSAAADRADRAAYDLLQRALELLREGPRDRATAVATFSRADAPADPRFVPN
ncbi:MAG TPA: MarR family transcriptional regulator [Thermoplasmata archaeon]|nr:MarR family transcriptional regulator [Thermoplasmata archaeon]